MSQAGRSLSKRSKHILIFLLRFSPFKLKKKKKQLESGGSFWWREPVCHETQASTSWWELPTREDNGLFYVDQTDVVKPGVTQDP